MAYFSLAFNTIKLLILITKAKTEDWTGGEAWKVKTSLLEKYRPDDVLTVSELKQRLNAVSLKDKQDPSRMFEEMAAIHHAYLKTKANLGSQDLSGVVFAAAPDKYHYMLNITTEMKGNKLNIDNLENEMYKFWRQGGGKPRGNDDKNEIVVPAFTGTCYLFKSQGHKAAYCPKKGNICNGGRGRGGGGGRGNQGRGSSWEPATNVAHLDTQRGTVGK
jgi:hypothetical protein